MAQSKRWLWTNNQVGDSPIDYSHVAKECEYFAYGLEHAPSTGHKHHQGYAVFKTRHTRGGVSKLFKPIIVHVGDKESGPCRGTHEQCKDYIIKEN